MADYSPPILRPKPRRPFQPNGNSINGHGREDSSASPSPNPEHTTTTSGQSSSAQFLDLPSLDDAQSSLSRPSSFANLTSSTLYGIYSPTASLNGRDDFEANGTPWGMGAQTPIRRPSVDEATYELMRDRSHIHRRRSSFRPVDQESRIRLGISPVALAFRILLLFALGVGYGVLITHLQGHEQTPMALMTVGVFTGQCWEYLTLWGFVGVLQATMLVGFDQIWEGWMKEGKDSEAVLDNDVSVSKQRATPSIDWALVVRGVGAFVGIMFAIRKLDWVSTLQVSMALAVVNPILWWLIDRSIPGLVMSTTFGVVGSAFFLSFNPDIMPGPSLNPLFRNNSAIIPKSAHSDTTLLYGLADQDTFANGVWMLSVLFCGCLCFGNIGRRLSWDKEATTRGRWAGLQ